MPNSLAEQMVGSLVGATSTKSADLVPLLFCGR
jgi:hypothetical protein